MITNVTQVDNGRYKPENEAKIIILEIKNHADMKNNIPLRQYQKMLSIWIIWNIFQV